jgi:WhiB family redox-sensing transcriptional regulator
MTEPPNWMDRAACQGVDISVFYPEAPPGRTNIPRGIGRAAARLCFGCPVQDACLDWALEKERFGTWGGTTEIDRVAMRKGIIRKRCPVCASSRPPLTADAGQICLSCGMSWVTRQPRENAPAPAR